MNNDNKIEFHFPFKPYSIQIDLMNEIYSSLNNKRVLICESPTGTGKTMSLICSSFKWLKDHSLEYFDPYSYDDTQKKEEEAEIKGKASKIAWLADFKKKKQEEEKKQELLKQNNREKLLDEQLKQLRDLENRNKLPSLSMDDHQYLNKTKRIKKHTNTSSDTIQLNNNSENSTLDDNQYTLDDYQSDDDFDELKSLNDPVDNEKDEDDIHTRKIYYCSRTHSQLGQYIDEVKKTVWNDNIRLVTLSSRKLTCINENVRYLSSTNQINDRCLDMIKSNSSDKKKDGSKCSYYNGAESMKNHIMAKIRDIEDLLNLGKTLQTCPYYGSRSAIKRSEVVVLPYNTILHKETRESIGIDLRGQIIIFDEAHNLIETIERIYSVEITLDHIFRSQSQLIQYKERYRDRLKAKNLNYIDKVQFVLKSFIKYLNNDDDKDGGQSSSVLLTVNEFLFNAGIDNINIFKILKFMDKTEIAKKVNGFCNDFEVSVKIMKENRTISRSISESDFEKHRPCLLFIQQFLSALTNKNVDGRVLVSKDPKNKTSYLKYVLLNPEVYFQEIVSKAHSVILAGGTMQPFEDYKLQLFGVSNNENLDRLETFSCGHIIPDSNLNAYIISEFNGNEFLFNYNNRNNVNMITALGKVVLNICKTVPDGVVLFLPSYQYEEMVVENWKQSGIYSSLNEVKKIYREPKESNLVNNVLKEYTNHILQEQLLTKTTGSLLLSVVGGKLSEGINFKDRLGRCVIMVGMPYPNANDPVLKAKLEYLEKSKSIDPGNYYETICMRAVNQSIGRSIRHVEDYSTIVLIDKRYQKESVKAKIPQWISSRLKKMSVNDMIDSMKIFFETKS